MNMKRIVVGVALLWLVAVSMPAQTNEKMAQAAANAAALRQYQWKSRTEIQKDGETKNVQVALMRYDSNGELQKTPVSGTPEPDLPKFGLRKMIAQKKLKEFRERVQELAALAKSYSELPPEQMKRFMATASMTAEREQQQKLIRIEGQNVLQPGDSMTMWIDPVSRKQRRVEIQTVLDGKPVRIVSEFQDIPNGGPTYMALSRVNYNSGNVVIITENFDYARVQLG